MLSHCLVSLAIASIRVLGKMPQPLRIGCGYLLGSLAYLLSGHHRHIARVNLSLCFPDMESKAKERLIYRNFCQLGIGICETAYSWCGPIEEHIPPLTWDGQEKLTSLLKQGRQILLISGHFSCLDPGLIIFSRHFPITATYKMHSNPRFNRFLVKCRQRHLTGLISSKDTIAIKQAFKRHDILWFSIDQDIGSKHSLFAPFFATQAASHAIAWRWSKITKAEVLLLHIIRGPGNRYRLILSHLPDFAKMDIAEAVKQQNLMLTQAIQQAPSQYLWLHKKFKTHPQGKNVYQRK